MRLQELLRVLYHNVELHSLYRLSNIFRVIKHKKLRWVSHIARMEEGRSALKNCPHGADKFPFQRLIQNNEQTM